MDKEGNRMLLPGFTQELSNEQWEFTSANTQYLTHGLFPYPARMIPQIAGRLISLYWHKTPGTGLLADVFCGSGTVLVEASIRGIPSLGIDINPFAIFLTKAKTTSVDREAFTIAKEKILSDLEKFAGKPVDEYIPSFDNLHHWFKPAIIIQLSFIREAIEKIENENIQRIFRIAFAHAVMRCSNVNWKSSRYIRVFAESKLEAHNPDAFIYFRGFLGDTEKRLVNYSARKQADTIMKQEDARHLSITDGQIDLIITSPPYGEERNTIPYIRWSRLFLLWLGFGQKEIKDLETLSLGGGGITIVPYGDIPSNTFWEAVQGVPAERLKEAVPFVVDYLSCLKEMRRVLRSGGKACIVIGHRSISQRVIDMGKVTKELGAAAGLIHETTYFRNIPKKMIPWTGPTGETIGQESIVVLSKQG